jgi:hypothetical protein
MLSAIVLLTQVPPAPEGITPTPPPKLALLSWIRLLTTIEVSLVVLDQVVGHFSRAHAADQDAATHRSARTPTLSVVVNVVVAHQRRRESDPLVGKAGVTIKTLEFDVSLVDFVAPTWTFP